MQKFPHCVLLDFMFKQFVFFTPSFDVEALIDEKINKKRFFAKTDEVDDLIDGKIHLI